MSIISLLPVTLQNGQIADATQVMADLNQIVNNVNSNAAALNGNNAFVGVQTIGGDTVVTATASQTLTNKYISGPGITLSIMPAAKGDGLTDDYTAISSAIATVYAAGGGAVFFPRPTAKYICGTTLVLPEGVRLVGEGYTTRWRSTHTPTVVSFTGSGAAVSVVPAASSIIDSVQIYGIQFDGTNAQAGCHGLYLNATAGGSSIEGFLCENSAFTNFPGNQSNHTGNVFDAVYKRTTFMNPARTALDCVNASGSLPSQLTFDDCWFSPYTTGTWGYTGNGVDVRFIGGTVAPYDNSTTGANGINHYGGLQVLGTHIENRNSAATGNIGIRFYNSSGSFIDPSACLAFGTGIQVGFANGDANAASNWVIAGSGNGNNIGAGGHDVVITNGGSRSGVILGGGAGMSVLDNRAGTDGVFEVLQMQAAPTIKNAKLLVQNGSSGSPAMSFTLAPTTGFYCDGTFSYLRGNVGIPGSGAGSNGDMYFRSDGTAGASIYQKRAGAWVAIA